MPAAYWSNHLFTVSMVLRDRSKSKGRGRGRGRQSRGEVGHQIFDFAIGVGWPGDFRNFRKPVFGSVYLINGKLSVPLFGSLNFDNGNFFKRRLKIGLKFHNKYLFGKQKNITSFDCMYSCHVASQFLFRSFVLITR